MSDTEVTVVPAKVVEKKQEKPRSLAMMRSRKKRAFLAALVESGGSVTVAADAAGIARHTYRDWVDKDPVFAEAFTIAFDESTVTLEAEAVRRATVGDLEPIIHKGDVVGHRSKRSDNLLMFLLKERKPSYRDNFTQQVGIWGGDGKVNVEFNIPRPPVAGPSADADG